MAIIHEPIPKNGYADHPIAAAFPMMGDVEFAEFATDIEDVGLREAIVLAPIEADKPQELGVLDGRNRQKACILKGVSPIYRFFDPERDGESIVAFVTSQNLKRRHLNPSQAAMAAAKLLPFYEAEAADRKAATQYGSGAEATATEPQSENGAQEPAASSEQIIDTGGDFAQAPPRAAKKSTGKSSKQVAKRFGVGHRSVEKAKTLLATDPNAAAEVTAGKRSLNNALSGKPSAGSKAEQEYNEALARIEKICGAQQAKGIREGAILRNRKDVIAYAKLDDKKMLAIRGLIDQGWPVKKAVHYKAEDLLPTHRIIDVANRAAVAGGKYEQDVHIENSGIVLRLKVEILKGEAMKHRKAKKAGAKK